MKLLRTAKDMCVVLWLYRIVSVIIFSIFCAFWFVIEIICGLIGRIRDGIKNANKGN